jgi:hypothetical protein
MDGWRCRWGCCCWSFVNRMLKKSNPSIIPVESSILLLSIHPVRSIYAYTSFFPFDYNTPIGWVTYGGVKGRENNLGPSSKNVNRDIQIPHIRQFSTPPVPLHRLSHWFQRQGKVKERALLVDILHANYIHKQGIAMCYSNSATCVAKLWVWNGFICDNMTNLEQWQR